MYGRAIRLRCLMFSLCTLVVIVYWALIPNSETIAKQKSSRDINTELRIFKPSQFVNDSDFDCVTVRITDLTFPICVYTEKEDLWISGAARKGGYFEREFVVKFIELFRKLDNVTFLDLGANLGLFTLPISHLGRKVVAVEPNPETFRRLAKSIELGKIADRVDVLNIAITNQRSTAAMNFDPKNRGDTFVTNTSSSQITALTTTLDSLLPIIRNKRVIMKADTQGSEIKIFTEEGASRFFDALDVPLIMMEFHMYVDKYQDSDTHRAMVDNFLKFFYNRNYVVYGAYDERQLTSDWSKWPIDVIFKKSNLTSRRLFSLSD